MAKAKKAPQKKTQASRQNRGIRIASALFVALGVLVVLSMILTSIFTQNPQPIPVAATAIPPVISTVVSTTTP